MNQKNSSPISNDVAVDVKMVEEEGVKALGEFVEYANAFNVFAEREGEIKLLMYALLNKEHVLFKGSPGTAKSQLAMGFMGNIQGMQVFSQQFTAFMDESYIFGPQLIDELKKGIIKHNTVNSLVDCEGAFLDEFFNANEETIVACNEVLNERTFTRNGQREICPLVTAVLTTNQERESEKKLLPIYDRILFTSKVLRVADEAARRKMYKNAMLGRLDIPATFHKDKLFAIHRFIDSIKVEFSDGFMTLLDKLLKEYQEQAHLYISDRKVVKSLKFLKICALLAGRRHVVPMDLEELRYVWTVLNEPTMQSIFDACFVKVKAEFAKIEKEMNMIQNFNSTVAMIKSRVNEVVGYGDLKALKTTIKSFRDDVNNTFNNLTPEMEKAMVEVSDVEAEVLNKLKVFRKSGAIDDEVSKDDFEWFQEMEQAKESVTKDPKVKKGEKSAIDSILGDD